MNTANNKRRRESVERMEKVFMELLETKNLNEIKVSDICKKAELNRTTFYANYDDIYSMAESIKNKLEKNLGELYRKEVESRYNSNDYLKLFQHIYDNQISYKTYFKLGFDNYYKIFAYDTKLAEEHFGNRFIEYHMEFFKSGITRIIKLWLENGCKESPEDMVTIIKDEYRGRQQ